MDTVEARFKTKDKLKANRASLVLCGKRDKHGHETCPVVFGELWVGMPTGPDPLIRVYGIFKRVKPGVYQPTTRAIEQAAAGKPARIRRRHVSDEKGQSIDLGQHGERVVDIVRDFPVRILCYSCRQWNILTPPA